MNNVGAVDLIGPCAWYEALMDGLSGDEQEQIIGLIEANMYLYVLHKEEGYFSLAECYRARSQYVIENKNWILCEKHFNDIKSIKSHA